MELSLKRRARALANTIPFVLASILAYILPDTISFSLSFQVSYPLSFSLLHHLPPKTNSRVPPAPFPPRSTPRDRQVAAARAQVIEENELNQKEFPKDMTIINPIFMN